MKNAESKPLLSYTFIFLLLLIFLRPFFSGLAYPVFESCYEIFVIFLVIAVIISRRGGLSVLRSFSEGGNLPYGYILPILLLLSAYIISTIFSINTQNSIKEIIRLISYVSIFFIVSQINDSQKNTLIKTIAAAAAIISVYSIYQYFWGYQHTLDYLKKANSDFLLNSSYARDILIQKRAIGTFPSPNILAGYLIMMFFITVSSVRRTGQLSRSANGLRFLPSAACAAIIAIALLLTKSFGAWLSFMAALLILFSLSYKSVKYKKLILASSLIAIFLVIAFILITRWERLINLNNPQNSITQRLNYWRTAIAVIKDHPLLGVGPGNFQEVFLKYKIGLSTNTRYAHNIFLHTWSEAGVMGFIAISSLIIAFLTKYKSENKYLFLAGLAFLFHNLIDNTYFIPEVGLFWWVLMALI